MKMKKILFVGAMVSTMISFNSYASNHDGFNININPKVPDVFSHHEHQGTDGNYQQFDNLYLQQQRRGDSYSWRSYQGNVPMDAVIGGYEPAKGRSLYICQAHYHGGIHPGKLVDGNCNVTYGGSEHPQSNFRVLVGRGFNWIPGSNGYVPSGSVPGGYEKGHPIYICKARYQNGEHPGKISGNTCNIGYSGREIQIPDYQVLAW